MNSAEGVWPPSAFATSETCAEDESAAETSECCGWEETVTAGGGSGATGDAGVNDASMGRAPVFDDEMWVSCINETGGETPPALTSAAIVGGATCAGGAITLDKDSGGTPAGVGSDAVELRYALWSMSAKGAVASDAMPPLKPATAAFCAAFGTMEAADEICIGGDQKSRRIAQRLPVTQQQTRQLGESAQAFDLS